MQTFNMLLFNTENPHTTPPEKQAAIARMLKTPVGRQNPRLPDILLLQEVHSKRMLEKFLRDQGLAEAYPNVAFFDPWQMEDRESTAKAGQAILTRPGIAIEASRRLSDGNSPKPVGEAVLNIDGRHRLYAYTVHTRYTPWHPDPKTARRAYQLASSIRLGQIEHLRDRIREIVQEEPEADVIVAGDFNATGTREPARFAKVLGQAGLKRVDSRKIPYTQLWRSEHKGDHYQKLDFIFYREGGALRGTKDAGIMSRPDGNPFSYFIRHKGQPVELDASDHYPLWARFRLEKAAARQNAAHGRETPFRLS